MRLASALSAVVLASTLGALPAAAGGWCRSDCVAVAPVETVVRPAHTVMMREPAVMGTRVQRVETQPGYWTAVKQPAQYGFVQKSVVAQPASVRHETVPARYQTVHETVVVRPASVRYEMKADCCGRMVRCEVQVPAVTRTVARQVMVSAAHTIAHTTPAVYKTVTMQTELAPAKTSYQYTPPKVDYVAHPVMLKAETVRAVHVPAEVVHTGRSHWTRWH